MTRPPIPVHIVAGPLGVGKTTAILRYLQHNAEYEHVAVLVNDFGPVGIDGAIIDGSKTEQTDGAMKVLTIPGGCLCCASADALAAGIPKLASLPGVTRIIIEPSGLAMPAQVVDLLRQLAPQHNLDIRPTIVLLDAGEFRSAAAEHMPYYRRLVESADVLVANRCDRADDRALSRFQAWAEALHPPKLRVITTTQGELPDSVFAVHRPGQVSTTAMPRPSDDTAHSHPEHAEGRTWPPDVVFDLNALQAMLRRAAPERFKGIFHTDQGWRLLQWARGELDIRPIEHRRDNRADWIISSSPANLQEGPIAIQLDRCARP